MALILSTMLAQISGSIAGATYARNRFGMYARSRSNPVNPATPAQAAVRSYFSEAIEAWRDATPSRRLAYETFAAGTPVINKVGQAVYLTGAQWWVSYWSLYRQGGLTPAQAAAADVPFTTGFAPPAVLADPDTDLGSEPTTGLIDNDSTGTTANVLKVDWSAISNLDSANDLVAILQCSAPQWPTINFFKGPWLTIAQHQSLTGTIPDSEESYNLNTLFGVVVPAGSKVFTRFRIINNDTLQSPPQIKAYTALTYTVV